MSNPKANYVPLSSIAPNEVKQPVILYLPSRTDATVTIDNKPFTTLQWTSDDFKPAIYIHHTNDVTIQWGDSAVITAKALSTVDETALLDLTNAPDIFDIVAHYLDDPSKKMKLSKWPTQYRKWSPLAIDGEAPHAFKSMELPSFSKLNQKPAGYLRRLRLPSTHAASVAVAMYTAAYVLDTMNSKSGGETEASEASKSFQSFTRYVTMQHAHERLERLFNRITLDPREKGVLLTANLSKLMKGRDSPWTCCANMLTALPLWTRLWSDVPWDKVEWNAVSAQLRRLCKRSVDAPLQTSMLPYACAQFYPNYTLDELMRRLSLRPLAQQHQSFNRLEQMGVDYDEIGWVARVGNAAERVSFGPRVEAMEETSVAELGLMWQIRCIWNTSMTMVKPEWRLPKSPISVYLAPFGCWMTPMVNMNNPGFAQFPISTSLFKQNLNRSPVVNGTTTMELLPSVNPLLLYQLEDKICAARAPIPGMIDDEHVRAVIFNVDRLVHLMLFVKSSKQEAVLPNDHKVDVEFVFAITILEQILGASAVKTSYVDADEAASSGLAELSNLPNEASVPLGELVLASLRDGIRGGGGSNGGGDDDSSDDGNEVESEKEDEEEDEEEDE